MLELDNTITINDEVMRSPNLCDRFSDDDLQKIGEWCHECYERDLQTREHWYRRSEGALELAMQVQEDKTFPWANCSNIIFPLVTIAALQFHARAYPVIISGNNVVRCEPVGNDPAGIDKVRADKISRHMSWQVLEQDTCWEEGMDRGLLNLAIVGCGFKKSYFDAGLGHNVSEYVQAKDLVFDYWAKSIESGVTKTHVIPLYRNEIHSRVKAGAYRDILGESWYIADASIPTNPLRDKQDQRDGLNRPQSNHNTPFTMLEQHCWLDLDGDGYAEPYIVTFEEASHCVVRIVARFDREADVQRTARGDIIKIRAWEYFTKLPFIPSPDGGALDIGFGTLVGPLNESVNSAINQLFDAGTLSNTAGGFLGRGAKIRGGVYEFSPFSWERVDSTGDDLRKSIFPLPVREPSDVMFKLLGLIIDYTDRISGSTDISVGVNVGQNTPAETARTMNENGQRIYTAIFKRIWRGMKREFEKLYELNSVYLPASVAFGSGGTRIGREDYRGPAAAVRPFADPHVSTAGERYTRAMALKQLSVGNPAYNVDEVEIEVLRSIGIEDPGRYYMGAANAPEPPPDVRIQVEQIRTQRDMQKLEFEKQKFVLTLQEQAKLNNVKIAEIQAKVIKIYEEGRAIPEKQRIEAFRASMELIREENKNLESQMKSIMEIGRNELEARESGGFAGGMEAAPSDTGGILPPPEADTGTEGFMG